jgi:hypothetical protein
VSDKLADVNPGSSPPLLGTHCGAPVVRNWRCAFPLALTHLRARSGLMILLLTQFYLGDGASRVLTRFSRARRKSE